MATTQTAWKDFFLACAIFSTAFCQLAQAVSQALLGTRPDWNIAGKPRPEVNKILLPTPPIWRIAGEPVQKPK